MRLSPSIRIAAASALTALALYGLLLGQRPGYFAWDDNVGFFLPQYVYNARALSEHGRLPLLNFHQYLGHRHLASGQSAVLYPPVYGAVWTAEVVFGDVRHTMDLLALFHLAAAAGAMTLLLLQLSIRKRLAFWGGLLWVTFPFVPEVGRNWIVVTGTAFFLPLEIFLLERLIRRPGAGRGVALALAKTLFFLQGYVQYVVMVTLAEGVYLLLRWTFDGQARELWRDHLRALIPAALGSLALGAPLLLPMLESKALSAYRTGQLSFEEFLSNTMPWRVFGQAQWLEMAPEVIHQGNGSVFFVGLPFLLSLGVLPFLRGRGAERADEAGFWAPPLAALGTSLLFLLASSRFWGVVYTVPVLSSFRWPFKHFLLFLGFGTVAALACGEILLRRSPKAGSFLVPGMLLLAITIHIGVLLDPANDRPFGPSRLEEDVQVLVEETRERLGDPEAGRVISLWLLPNAPHISRYLVFNFATLARAHHLGGYDPLVARWNLDLAMNLEFSNIFRWSLERESLDHLSAWSVRYFLIPEEERLQGLLEAFPQLRRRSSKNGIEVWENPAAVPFAALADAPYDALEVRWGIDEVRIRTEGRGGDLRLTLLPWPGYEAEADGRSVELVMDSRQRLVARVPSGTEEVVQRGRDPRFRIGLALAFVAILAFYAWVRHESRRGAG